MNKRIALDRTKVLVRFFILLYYSLGQTPVFQKDLIPIPICAIMCLYNLIIICNGVFMYGQKDNLS